MKTFENFLNESMGKVIYTVIRYNSNNEPDHNDTASFLKRGDAENYLYKLERDWSSSNVEIVENILK